MSELSIIETLAEKIRSREKEVERWLDHTSREVVPPVYSSVDIRNAGYKIGVVDTNLFPSGFNNLCETFAKEGSHRFKEYLGYHYPEVRKILLIPEDHTRNLFYFQHLEALRRMIKEAGYEVVIGSSRITLPPTIRNLFLAGNLLQTKDFVPDLILLNNDLSEGFPSYLTNLKQPVIPFPHLGWYRRKKDEHFRMMQKLLAEMGELLEIDPWFFSPMTVGESGIDLADSICLKRLAEGANRLLMLIRQKHLEYQIKASPYLFIKNNSGTYGMAVTTVRSGDEILKWNRRTRNKMESSKGGQKVSEYLIQEGIATSDFYRGKPFEPVVYLIGGHPIGIFFRIHQEKDQFESLNARGMEFTCRCFHKLAPPSPSYHLTYHDKGDLFVITSLLGRMASLAVGLEGINSNLSKRSQMQGACEPKTGAYCGCT